MRCLILGGDWMLGHKLLKNWQPRHEVRDGRGHVGTSGLEPDRVCKPSNSWHRKFDEHRRVMPVVEDFKHPVSKKIVLVILSYVGYVNRTVWRRSVS